MRRSHFLAFLMLSACLSLGGGISSFSQSKHILPIKDSLQIHNKTDTLKGKIKNLQSSASQKSEHIKQSVSSPVDSITSKLSLKQASAYQRIDSLKENVPQGKIQSGIDSLNKILNQPNEQIKKAMRFEGEVKDKIQDEIPGMEKAAQLRAKRQEHAENLNDISSDLGLDPLGEGIKPNLSEDLPGLPNSSISPGEAPGTLGAVDLPGDNGDLLNAPVGGNDLTKLPESIQNISGDVSSVGEKVKNGNEILNEGSEYVKTAEEIGKEGLSHTENIDALAEQQVSNVDGIDVLKENSVQVENLKGMAEEVQNKEALMKKWAEMSKELAMGVVIANQDKVDESMKKIGKYKRKFSNVQDMRNLPKRAENPMRELHWRERLSPGFSLQTIRDHQVWIQLDPQVLYKLNKNMSAGAGGMYRFSMNPSRLTFSDFGLLSGVKAFARNYFFKGFFIQTEVQHLKWKPLDNVTKDFRPFENATVIAAGIGKSYTIGKSIKGNAQTLYHYTIGENDPYHPRIMIRIGIDFSIKKKKEKSWEKRLKSIEKKSTEEKGN